MRRKTIIVLTLATATVGGLTVLVLLINIILNHTQAGHTIPELDLWAGAVSAVFGLATLILPIVWHQTEEAFGKRALIAAEAVLFLLLIMSLYGILTLLLFFMQPHASTH